MPLVRVAFVLDRVNALAADHPEGNTSQPFQAVPENYPQALAAAGLQGLASLAAATHTWMTCEEFDAIVRAWFAATRQRHFGRP